MGEWKTREKPEFQSGPLLLLLGGPQRAFQTPEGFSDIAPPGVQGRGVPEGISPLLGPPCPTLPYLSKCSSPPPQACRARQSQLYYPRTGAALQ